MAKDFDRIREMSDSTLMIVDGLNLAFRYLHAKSTQFVDDYIRVVDSLKKSYKAGKVIIVCDKGSSSYRKSIYPDYKANRKEKFENQTEEKIANHAYYTFWYVIPTLPMFLMFPYLLPKLGFWATIGASVVVTVICFGLFAIVMKNFGVNLL